ncbi:MAG TPA: type II toxin-antitoxin system VapC family toxin [Gammaproteobacteria bacterium]|nr:type II toxin-antitoxin system VapC family toxin [Gammaproteobacteria bacterium]
MILVDTSVWVDHLRTGDERLADLLNRSQVVIHPFVIGELACGNLRKRDEVLRLLNDLPQAAGASQDEVLHLIEHNKLMGLGIGFIDAHLLASAALSDTAAIWTRDKRLQKAARKLKLAFD